MTDTDRDPHAGSASPDDIYPAGEVERGPGLPGHDDARPDIEQAVMARSDAVARGEGGDEPDMFTRPGATDGVGGTGGEVKNDTDDQQ